MFNQDIRMFIGVVEAIDDPLSSGRVRVRCFGYHTEDVVSINTSDLPWAQTALPTTSASSGGVSETHALEIGSWVMGVFTDGSDAQNPVVMCSLPGTTDDIPDWSPLTRGEDTTARYIDDIIGTPQSPYQATFPYNKVRQTTSGHIKEYDDTPGAERIRELHKSGTQYEVHPNGDEVKFVVGDSYRVVFKNDSIHVHGNVNIIVDGDASVSCTNLDATVTENATAVIGQQLNVTAQRAILNSNAVEINAPLTLVNGALTVQGPILAGSIAAGGATISDSGSIISSSGVDLDSHTHSYTWTDSGGAAITSPANP